MDNMLQTQILHANTRSLYIPTYIQRITIDALHHMLYCKDLDVVPIQYCSSSNVIKLEFEPYIKAMCYCVSVPDLVE